VVSDLPVFRETLGEGGALFAAPGDDAALAGALLRIDADAALRERLVATAAPALERHALPAAADALHALLAEAAAEGPPR
jgi:glycosyltransferase involved in cell wall biosynthesis